MSTRYGIRTLQHLRDRCVITSRGDCWTYRQQVYRARTQQWDPNIWLSDLQRTETLQRAAWLLAGRPLMRGTVVWRICGNDHCCNPAHLRSGTRADMGAWLAAAGRLRGLPERRAINRRNRLASGGVVLSAELADWIRDSRQTGVQVAHALGVTVQCISRVRCGQTWAPTVRGASVWALGGTAAATLARGSAPGSEARKQ